MNRSDLLRAVQHFQVQALSEAQILEIIQDRARLIKPLLKHSTLERLGGLQPFFLNDDILLRIMDCDERKMGRMLSCRTEGIFGAKYTPIQLCSSVPEKGISKFWGLCRNSKWCYGEIEFFKRSSHSIDEYKVDFYYLKLEDLLGLWPTWQDIWNRLGEFVLADKERVERRISLIQSMATRIEIENALVNNAMQIA